MADDTLKLEDVQLDTINDGRLWDTFHEVQKQVVDSIPTDEEKASASPYDASKPRTITVKLTYTPKGGGDVAIEHSVSHNIPPKTYEHGSFVRLHEGRLKQFAAKQGRLPNVGAPEQQRTVTPIRAVRGEEQ